MSSVTYRNVGKRYGTVDALKDFNLEIADGEFVVFVGPSGSGKTTALRILAGLERQTGGSVMMGERVIDDVPPADRDVAMVFQSYALYPHMTVFDNIAYGLRRRGYQKAETIERVRESASMLDMEELLDRYPGQLSGGQRQRVAVSRALARRAQVLLMDEPLSNLDAKLRSRAREEIRRVQQQVGTTTVYVTHDQVEAMTMGDRVVVMQGGAMEQVADARGLYESPRTTFVAGFIGSPSMNLVDGRYEPGTGTLRIGDDIEMTVGVDTVVPDQLTVGVRPEDLVLVPDDEQTAPGCTGSVEFVEELGREAIVGITTASGQRFVLSTESGFSSRDRSTVRFRIKPERLYLFDRDTGNAVETPGGRRNRQAVAVDGARA